MGWWQLGIRRVWPARLQATAPRLCFGHCPRLTGPLAQALCYRAPPGPGPVWAAPVTLPFLYQDGQGGQATHPLRCSALEAGTPGLPDLHLQPWLPAGPAQPGPSFRAIQTGPCCRWRRLGRAAPPPPPPLLQSIFLMPVLGAAVISKTILVLAPGPAAPSPRACASVCVRVRVCVCKRRSVPLGPQDWGPARCGGGCVCECPWGRGGQDGFPCRLYPGFF